MIIYVLDGLNGISGIIDVYQSVIWNVQFFGESDFELKLIADNKNINTLVKGAYLVRDFDITPDGFQNVMIIENREIEYNIEEGWILTLTGGGLKKILKRRVVWNQTNLTGSVENGIRQVITENAIEPADATRQIPDLILDDPAGFTDTFDIQLLGENIAEWLTSVCTAYGIGWDVYIKNNKYVFNLKKGADRTYEQDTNVPVVFSPEFDNLISATYSDNYEEFRNAALIGGEGEGIEQRTATVGTAAGLDRYEDYIDGGSVSSNGEIITLETYIKMLEDYGNEELKNAGLTEKFEGQILPDGVYKLDEDYFLGDLIQIDNGLVSAKSRITEIIYAEDDNGFTYLPTFGVWED